jgi:Thymidylate synthase complementing protein
MIEAKIIEDSVSIDRQRLTTMQVKFHRFILPEFNTHRVFSRNFSSSRAIPTKKLLEQVLEDPAIPVHWGKNQPGMQASEELMDEEKHRALSQWKWAAATAGFNASRMFELGVHKQVVNRMIEPYLWATGIVSSTSWANWFALRAHEDAQPEIKELAFAMLKALNESEPKLLEDGEWHLPYISSDERKVLNNETLKKVSAARCCRVSYLKHDGTAPNLQEDLALFDRLAGSVPLHASPLEHQGTPGNENTGNFTGWTQFRKLWELEMYRPSC